MLDHLHTLNDLTPKVRCKGQQGVDPNLIFGLDTKLFSDPTQSFVTDGSHNDEVETITVWRGRPPPEHVHSSSCNHKHDDASHVEPSAKGPTLTRALLTAALSALPKESIWRVKGFVVLADASSESLPSSEYIRNWAFGRHELVKLTIPADQSTPSDNDVLFTVMGERGEMRRFVRKFARALGAEIR